MNSSLKKHQKQFPMGTRENKFQSADVQTQLKFYHQFHFTSTFKCSIRSLKLFSTFGVVRNNIFGEDVQNSHTDVCNAMLIILVQSFCPLVTLTSGGFLFNVISNFL